MIVDAQRRGGQTFAVMLEFVVLLVEYTNIFNEWLAWRIVPAVVGLAGFDIRLRAKRRRDD